MSLADDFFFKKHLNKACRVRVVVRGFEPVPPENQDAVMAGPERWLRSAVGPERRRLSECGRSAAVAGWGADQEPSARGVAMTPQEGGGEFRRGHSTPSTAEPRQAHEGEPGSVNCRPLSRGEHRRAPRVCAHSCTQTCAASGCRMLLLLRRRPWRGARLVVVRSDAAWWTLVVWLLLTMASAPALASSVGHLSQCGTGDRAPDVDACVCPAGKGDGPTRTGAGGMHAG